MDHTRHVPDTGFLETALTALGAAVADFITSPHGTAVLRTLFADGHNPEVISLASSMWLGSDAEVPRKVVTRAVARGELSAEADGDLLLFTIAGALSGVHRAGSGPLMLIWGLLRGNHRPTQHDPSIARFAYRALIARTPPSRRASGR
jgi:hypothetical protein